MEFLKAFEEAIKLGMTKEEFLPIWELECKSRKTEVSSGAVVQSMEKTNSQFELNGCHGSTLQCQEQIKSDFLGDMKAQSFFNQLIEKQELQWKQFCQKCDQLQNEFHSHFEVLSNHISNTTEVHTSSLKLFLMQEINLLEQDLKKDIEDKFAGQKVLPKSLVTSLQKQASSQECHQSSADYKRNITGDNKLVKNVSLPLQVPVKTKPRGYEEKQMQNQTQLPYVCVGDQKMDLSKKDSQYVNPDNIRRQYEVATEANKYLPLKSNTEVNKISVDKKAVKNVSPLNVSSTNKPPSASSSEASIVGTGFYAEVISKQMKKEASITSLSNSSSKSKGSEFDFIWDKDIVKPKKTASSSSIGSKTDDQDNPGQTFRQPNYAKFTIKNSNSFASLHQDYITPYYYTVSQACKARFQISFDETCHLTVFLLVSNGKLDNSAVWPISFTSSGFVYNESSETPSSIWTLGPIRCSKPEPQKETTLKAAINLKTMRHTQPNVTYKILNDKGYVVNDCLSFELELQMIEKCST